MSNYTIEFQAMGCHIQAWLRVPSYADAQILQNVPVWFQKWEAKFSRFRSDSELLMLNQRHGQWVQVSPAMLDVIVAAVEGGVASKGIFNPLMLPALQAAGYDHSFQSQGFVPGKRYITNVRIKDITEIEIDTAQCAIRLPINAQLDLGGIVKGWAAQQAAGRLSTFGDCLVNAGGDMVAFGSPDEIGGWLVDVPNPVSDNIAFTVMLSDMAIATSGRDYHQWSRNGQLLHHIIDPRTGSPAETNVLSATVIALDAVQAEVWAKVALIEGRPTHLPTLLFYQNGSTAYNKEFAGLCTHEIR